MKCRNLWVAGTGAALGRLEPPVADSADTREMQSISVSDRFPVEFAIKAGQEAMSNIRSDGSEIGLHIFCNITFPGLYMWPASHYVSRCLMPNFPGISFTCHSMSASCLVAIEIAASMMEGRRDLRAALITAGDRFQSPEIARWAHDPSLVFGDGGGALVLSRDCGWARVLSVVSYTNHDLEGMHRGADGFRNLTDTVWPVDQRQRYRDCFAGGELSVDTVIGRQINTARFVLAQAIEEAGIRKRDICRFIFPFTGRDTLIKEFAEPLDVDPDMTLVDFGCCIGHLGSADQLVGLHEVRNKALVGSGEYLALIGMGAGQTWSIAVLQVV